MRCEPSSKRWRWGSVVGWSAIITIALLVSACRTSAQMFEPDSLGLSPAEDSLFHSWRFGLAAGFGWTAQNTRFNVFAPAADCGQFEGSVRKGPFGEIFSEVPFLFPSLLLTSYLQFSSSSIELSAPPHTDQTRDVNGEFINIVRQFRYNIDRSSYRLGVGAAWEPLAGVGIGISPTMTLLAGVNHEHTEHIIAPLGAVFSDNGSDVHYVNGAREVGFRRVTLGADISLRGRFPLSPRLSVHTQARGSLQFGSIANDIAWQENGVQILAGVSYDVAVKPVPPPPPPPPPMPVLAAKIAVKGVDEQGRQYDDPIIEIEEASRVEQVPIIPYIFFDSASADIPERYIRLAGEEGSSQFSVDSLQEPTPLNIHWEMLNILGQRMRSRSDVHLTLTGLASSDEPAADADRLGKERADAVAGYLMDVWGIEPERIATAYVTNSPTASNEETRQGREENRRVEFNFSEESMVAPVLIQRLAKIASPPEVVFLPEIIADTALTEWYITVVQGERELLRFDGTSLDQQKHWPLGDLRVSRELIPIRYILTARDVAGQTATAEGAFNLKQRVSRRQDGGVGVEVQEFSLVGFKYNSAELLPRHQTQLREISRQITPATRVSIIGYTDSVGTSDRNRQLSYARAKVVFDALTALRQRSGHPMPRDVNMQGLGRESFINELPEGRLLARMVRLALTTEQKR